MFRGFWQNLNWPIVGLSPMDGVTDAPFRIIMARYGKPDLMMTEFTSVEGICHGAVKALQAFIYSLEERPVVAQLFGTDPECFYKAAFVVAELGFDGIDINMGCPAKNVASKGAGAGLILNPKLAQNIIKSTMQAMIDWELGRSIEEVGLPENIVTFVRNRQKSHAVSINPNNLKQSKAETFITPNIGKKRLPVSVKTRIGYDSVTIEEWVKYLLEVQPVNISIHGRTLKQMYSGKADWEAIARAAEIIHQTSTTVLGNGDVATREEAMHNVGEYGVDGVLLGRSSFGNPWVFSKVNKDIQVSERLKLAIEHAKLYENLMFSADYQIFVPMRKHLAWYCRGFPNASELRQELMKANSAIEVERIIAQCNQY